MPLPVAIPYNIEWTESVKAKDGQSEIMIVRVLSINWCNFSMKQGHVCPADRGDQLMDWYTDRYGLLILQISGLIFLTKTNNNGRISPVYHQKSCCLLTRTVILSRKKNLATLRVEGMFSPSCAQNLCTWLFFVIFVFILTRTKEKNNLQSHLGTASLVCLSQLRGGCGKNRILWSFWLQNWATSLFKSD